ncbi:hypothetical protein LCGC14_0408350 [marine sediment metagenome]|uniref:Glyoxalase-related protein domain-containing protein n=2 Tax=root TaxID=1 RepID=A0A7V1BHG8_9RHOB|nr:glyoxalase superfamily protein [Sulfitobacter litoralis]HDZ53023.1 hypothetical protein [Sulfitobacter litoralis]
MSKDSTKTTKLKRDAQPEAVRDAKDAAGRLAAYLAGQGLKLSRAQALEALSCAAGAKDWNTFRAELSTPRVSAADIAKAEHRRILHFYKGGEQACSEAVMDLVDGGYLQVHEGMWRNRARECVEAVVAIFFQTQEREECPFDPSSFRQSFSLTGKGGFLERLATCEEHFPDSPNTDMARNFLKTLPGMPEREGKAWPNIPERTEDQWGYLSMQVSKPLGDLIDHNLMPET